MERFTYAAKSNHTRRTELVPFWDLPLSATPSMSSEPRQFNSPSRVLTQASVAKNANLLDICEKVIQMCQCSGNGDAQRIMY